MEKLKEADLIRPAKMSQWGFPTVLVNKPHSNKMRLCNDVRKLNDKTILQPYPMLNMNYLLADIGKRKCKYFSLIDLSDSYRQIPLTKRSQQIATMLFRVPARMVVRRPAPINQLFNDESIAVQI